MAQKQVQGKYRSRLPLKSEKRLLQLSAKWRNISDACLCAPLGELLSNIICRFRIISDFQILQHQLEVHQEAGTHLNSHGSILKKTLPRLITPTTNCSSVSFFLCRLNCFVNEWTLDQRCSTRGPRPECGPCFVSLRPVMFIPMKIYFWTKHL